MVYQPKNELKCLELGAQRKVLVDTGMISNLLEFLIPSIKKYIYVNKMCIFFFF